VVGGLYGNIEALHAIRAQIEAERATGRRVVLVFNGDFHWFDAVPDDCLAIERAVQAERAIAGNVELELSQPASGAGCGCAYPGFVDDATVDRSNRIIERLRANVNEVRGLRDPLVGLPRLLRLAVGGTITGVIHGDPESVAGWRFAFESVTDPAHPLSAAQVRAWADETGVDAFACSHTCLPWAASFGDIVVINNGSAGMPNFSGDPRVLVTRIAGDGSRHADSLYAIERSGVCWEAVAVTYDVEAWLRRFRRIWPPGSPAHESYHGRMTRGPEHDLEAVKALANGR
jgi:predicted phosphodiesterase